MGEQLSPAAIHLAAWLASGKLGLARHYVEWSIRCPSIGADSAVTAMAQEEIGHAAILRPAGGRPMHLPTFDEIEPPVLRTPLTSWAGLVGTAAAVEAAFTAVVEELAGGNCAVLARRVPKMVVEERYHTQFLNGWVAELHERAGARADLATAVEEAVEVVRPWAEAGAGDPALVAEGVMTRGAEAVIGAALEAVARRCCRGAA